MGYLVWRLLLPRGFSFKTLTFYKRQLLKAHGVTNAWKTATGTNANSKFMQNLRITAITPHWSWWKGSLLHFSDPVLIKEKLVCLITVHNEDCRRKQWIICQWLEGQWVNLWTTELLYLRVAASVTGESPSFVLVISSLVHYQNRAVTYRSRGRHSQVTAVSINRPGILTVCLKCF